MGGDLRLLLYAGIHSSGYYVPVDNVAWIPSLLGLPLNQGWQVLLACPEALLSLSKGLSKERFNHSFTRR